MKDVYRFETQKLDRLLPLHLVLDESDVIVRTGPTLNKLVRDDEIIGKPFADFFAVQSPRIEAKFEALADCAGMGLRLRFLPMPQMRLKAVAVPVADARSLLINMSFGISATDAVVEFGLTMSDFDYTNLTIEMLYLMEAKSAVMEELRHMNHRLQGAKNAAEEQAFTDTLTGLRNRRALEHVMGRYIARGDPFGLMHIDLDYFKQVNDSLGHAAGDAVLRRVADVLRAQTRVDDTIVRFGGDEFVVVFPRLTDLNDLTSIATRIIAEFEVPIPFEDQVCRISGSVGITSSVLYSSLDFDRVLNDADTALYQSKRDGRGCATVFSHDLRDEMSLGDAH